MDEFKELVTQLNDVIQSYNDRKARLIANQQDAYDGYDISYMSGRIDMLKEVIVDLEEICYNL